MYRYIILFSLCASGISNLIAAPQPSSKPNNRVAAVNAAQFSAEERVWLRNGLSAEIVEAYLKKSAQEFAEGQNGAPLSPAAASLIISKIQRFQKYPFFEYDTQINRAWLNRVEKFMDALLNARLKLHSFELNRQTKSAEYKQWQEYYSKNAQAMLIGIQKPVKFTDKEKLKELGIQKKEVLELVFPDQRKGGSQGKNNVPMPKK